MGEHKISQSRMELWLLAAVTAPVAHHSGQGWLSVLVMAALVLPVSFLYSGRWQDLPRWLAWIELIWLVLVTGILMGGSGSYWPSSGSRWFVPVTLVALAAWNAGSEKASRAGSVLLRILTGLFLLTAAVSVSQLEPTWLQPRFTGWQPELMTVLLLPSLAGIWGQKVRGRAYARIGLWAVAAAALVQGILSAGIAARAEAPFYEMSQALNAGGIRWELPAAAAMTLGWYATADFLINGCCELAAKAGIGGKRVSWIVFGAVSGVLLLDMHGVARIVAGFSLILWVLAPFLAEKNKSKKGEKSS